MRYCIYLLGVVYCFAGAACDGQKTPDKPVSTVVSPPPAPKVAREVGKVVPIEPIGATTSSYAYYLPKTYNLDHPAAVMLFFDSHARGKDPVKLYQGLADQYETILIGSNVSRNGQQPNQSLQIYDELIRDVKAKFSIDEKKITCAGFSGGARVAANLAQSRPEIKNVIACSAGFQPRQGDRFNYYAIVGKKDFNYQELRELEALLDDTQQRHIVDYWDGGHEWPPVDVMADAFDFVSFGGMKKGQDKLDSLVADAKTRFANKVKAIPKDE
jgi:predicted esterase